MNKIFLKDVFTSGEAALQTLKKKIYGKKFYHLGPARDVQLDQADQVIRFGRTNTRTGDRIHCPYHATQQSRATDPTLGSNP